MRTISLFLPGVFISILSFCQQPPSRIIRCRTFESMQEFRALHPNAETDAQFEAWLQQKMLQRGQSGQRTTAYYVIPVVFHIVHNGEIAGNGSNLSAAQIQQQLNQLNADFANLSGSSYGVASDIEIQFCLATLDTNGIALAEPGIDRIYWSDKTWNPPPYDGFASNSYVDQTIMPGSIWDPARFYNIWTLDLDGALLGKATFPSSSGIADLPPVSNDTSTHSGVFIEYESVGSICSPGALGSAFGLGRTLTHETGHFFGLRHIWGDALCGNDFCADTPEQDDKTSGCPGTGTLNGCTPSVPKMFENYMDYTDDPCVNTFTADQKTRMQTVMLNSPRRMELPGAGSCTGAAVNSIKFNYVCAQVSETGTGSSCPRFRDVSVNILVFSAANDNATLNFTKGGTAVDNIDYTIMPSSISFVNGDNLPKTVTIRIWDDAIAESAETLVLGYSITGTGVVAGASNQSFTLTINDDDVIPAIDNSGIITLFSENFGTSGGTFPAGWLAGSFSGAGSNEWKVSSNGGAGISGQCAHVTDTATAKLLTYDMTSESDAALVTPLINTTGHSAVRLSFTYKCEGELAGSSLEDFGELMYSTDLVSFFPILDPSGDPYVFQGVSTATLASNLVLPAILANTNFYLCFRWVNNDMNGTNPPFLIDDIVVSAPATQIESQSTNPGTENIFSNQDVYILSDNDDQLITRIQSANGNLNCITASITQSGNGTTNITTSTGVYSRSVKVVSITASPANTTATYQATLYFTTAELVAWGSLSGLQLLKVNDGVNLVTTTITPANGQLVPATVDDQRVARGYASFTGSFTGGFSQFMLVSSGTTLPVELMSFEAKAVRKSIVLNWSTSQELNNKGFAIERSADGTNFEKIGWVDGMINSNSRTDYTYSDNYVQPGIIYYYRLRQTDIDRREKLSVVRQAKIDQGAISLTISPNPSKDQVSLFISGSSASASVNLVNMQGQTVRKWNQVNASGTALPLNISGLASGLYMLQVLLPEQKLVEKLMIR